MSSWNPTIHDTDSAGTIRQKKLTHATRDWYLSRGGSMDGNSLRTNVDPKDYKSNYQAKKAFQEQWLKDYDAKNRKQGEAKDRAKAVTSQQREAKRHEQAMTSERQEQRRVMETNTSQVPSAGGREWNTWLENSRSPAPKIGLNDDWAKSDKSAFQGVIDAGSKGFGAVAGGAAPGMTKSSESPSNEASRWQDDSFGPEPGDGFDLNRFASNPMGLGDGKAVVNDYAKRFKSRFY